MSDERREVVVVDIEMPFWSIVILMVKWAIAAIPAIIILMVLGGIVSALLSGLFGGYFHWNPGRGWM